MFKGTIQVSDYLVLVFTDSVCQGPYAEDHNEWMNGES